MKSIFYGVAILVACGAAYFSFDLSNKFKALQEDSIATIADNKKTTALAEAADTDIKKEKAMGKRPPHVKAPDYLSKSPPVPEPKDVVRKAEPDPDRLDPVRYGDWELKGVAIDF